ncbi:hypothetical protein [Candidatus Methylomirabilis sp.]|uniref:hypothetical protein n=1 Tax=Candidatus Methylomirabilis sp. TaxID=2032687 RepID=UPI002A63A027|nr:hypothetical protein [Candidatus Methylomirabilis sp.]
METKSKSSTTAAWLVPSLAAIMAVLLAFWLPRIFSDKPELRFSLSSPISTKLLGTPLTSHIQEVAVSNVGDMAAKDVVLICDNGVLGYELYKSAETDKVQEYMDKGRLEVRYQDLPPGETFKVVLRASSPLSAYNLNLKHSQGVGKDVFAKTNPLKDMLSGSVIFVLYVLGWGWFSFKNMGIESDARFNPKRVLSRRKPWHIRRRKWGDYTSTAINAYFAEGYTHYTLESLQENVGYRYLITDKDTFDLDGEGRERANRSAVENFEDAALSAMKNARGKDEAFKILGIVVALDDRRYSAIRTAISKAWVEKMLDTLSWGGSLSLSDIALGLAERPDGILPDHWNNYVRALERLIHRNIEHWVRSDKAFEAVIDAEYFGSFSEGIQKLIRESVYDQKLSEIPKFFGRETDAREFLDKYNLSWMSEDDASKIRRNAEATIKLYQDKVKYERLLAGLVGILREGTCGTELEGYEDLAEPLKKLELEIADTRKRIAEDAGKLEECEAGVKEARTKVDRQLEIIASVLRGDIERFQGLEYPEDLFGPVNIARIREVISRIASSH